MAALYLQVILSWKTKDSIYFVQPKQKPTAQRSNHPALRSHPLFKTTLDPQVRRYQLTRHHLIPSATRDSRYHPLKYDILRTRKALFSLLPATTETRTPRCVVKNCMCKTEKFLIIPMPSRTGFAWGMTARQIVFHYLSTFGQKLSVMYKRHTQKR